MESFRERRFQETRTMAGPGYKADKPAGQPAGGRKVPISRSIDIKLEEDLEDLTLDMINNFNSPIKEDVDVSKKRENLGVCGKCDQVIETEAVLAGKLSFHAMCFKCDHCNTRLSGKYFMVDTQYFCEKHKSVALDKCTSCGDYITEGGAIVTGGDKAKYHPTCFNCSVCHTPLDGKFFTTNDGENICELDYKNLQAKCSHCKLPMLDKILTALENQYHPACFRCALCDKMLDGVPFIMDGKAINCRDCYSRYKAKQCFSCGQGIVSSSEHQTTLITCEGRSYHEECYNCKGCGVALAGELVYTLADDIFCSTCKK